MQLRNTIYQSEDFNSSREKVVIDGNDVFYKIEGSRISVASSLIPIEQYTNSLFDYFFKTYPQAKIIKFERAYQTQAKIPNKMIRLKHFDNNFRLELPNSIEEYKSSLGKKTRMHLGQYQRHIEKELYKSGGGYHMVGFNEKSKSIFDAKIGRGLSGLFTTISFVFM